ncbi:hypothetical protein NKOR_06325 [Candidatus Nitrosopumilus koreensis AR1]|uniref:Protein-disulfide isomerase n=1 Tax=Candidatus Nitrosopumilus koreensis AR1 TaxID=1229908 RepID=K0B9K4_9ARCH|nr:MULTISPECIES: hypothetical protein [Nitrosopumilus]AFS81146.1 hypothetical protein NKOR_06325 [Candidatus Nitrosopumilus koreensis AR1]
MPEDKILPKDIDSDYSLPGRYEESNPTYQEPNIPQEIPPKPRSKSLVIGIIAFVIVSSGFFSYYFINQSEIDSQIVQNTLNMSSEQVLADQYNIGKYGSDHTHAAILVVVDEEQLNFGLPQFQLSSKYIHFEDHNPYLIHKHATGVPLEMLFVSIGLKVTQDCIFVEYGFSESTSEFCAEGKKSVQVYLNGDRFLSDISQYEIQQGDRILITLDEKSISKHLKYLDSFRIFDVPEKPSINSGKDIFI